MAASPRPLISARRRGGALMAWWDGDGAARVLARHGDALLLERAMGPRSLAAMVTVYIILGVLYESFIHPITILSTLPSAGVGALLALMLCHNSASNALIGDIVKEDNRVIALGMYRFAINLGVAAGPATAGFLADRSFLYVFIGDAISSVIYGIIAFFALPLMAGLKPVK